MVRAISVQKKGSSSFHSRKECKQLWSACVAAFPRIYFPVAKFTTKFRRSKREKQDATPTQGWSISSRFVTLETRCYRCHSATVFPLYNQLLYSIRTLRSIRACTHVRNDNTLEHLWRIDFEGWNMNLVFPFSFFSLTLEKKRFE